MKKLASLAIVLMFVFVFGCATLLGCAKDDGTLVVWTFTDEVKKMVENYYLRDNPDKQVKVEVYPHDVFQTKLNGVLSTGKNTPDVMALEIGFVQKYVQRDVLMSLSSDGLDLEQKAKDNIYSYTLDVGKASDGRIMGLTWQAAPGGFFYRRSMAEALWPGKGNDVEFVQSKLDTWEKFMEVAALLKDNGDKRILSALNGTYRNFLAQRENPWIKDDVFYLDDVMKDYFEHCKALQTGTTGTDAPRGLYVNESIEFTQGWYGDMSGDKVFGYFLPPWGMQYYLKGYSEESGDWALVPGPDTYYGGGTWLSGYAGSNKKEQIKHLLEYILFNEDFLTEYADKTGEFLSNKTVVDKIKDDYSEEFLGGQNHYAIFAELVQNVSVKTISAYDSDIEPIVKEVAGMYAMQDNGYKTLPEALGKLKEYLQNSFPTITFNF